MVDGAGSEQNMGMQITACSVESAAADKAESISPHLLTSAKQTLYCLPWEKTPPYLK
jgi:hypothetical protein